MVFCIDCSLRNNTYIPPPGLLKQEHGKYTWLAMGKYGNKFIIGLLFVDFQKHPVSLEKPQPDRQWKSRTKIKTDVEAQCLVRQKP